MITGRGAHNAASALWSGLVRVIAWVDLARGRVSANYRIQRQGPGAVLHEPDRGRRGKCQRFVETGERAVARERLRNAIPGRPAGIIDGVPTVADARDLVVGATPDE